MSPQVPEALVFWLQPLGLAVLGLVVGSFLNVVIHRLPRMMERGWWGDVALQLSDDGSHQRVFGAPRSPALQQAHEDLSARFEHLSPYGLSGPPSQCPACGHRIRWFENIPLVSWLTLRGRCSACGTSIPWRYPLIEGLTALLFAVIGWRMGAQPVVWLWCGLAAVLIALSAIDWATTLLPDGMTLPLMWAGLLAAALGWTLPLAQAVWGAALGYLFLWSVYWLFKLVTGSGSPHAPWTMRHWVERAETGKDGMGHGDFKLLAALGAWLGAEALLPIVLMASLIGAIVGMAMKFTGALREGRYVPFGPFLAGGGLAVLLIGLPAVLAFMGWR
jgi:leader peptidase (prepilin peptidase)/N-methyltransferase